MSLAFDLTAGAGPLLVPLTGWRREEGCAASELHTRLRRSALSVGFSIPKEKKDPLQIGRTDPRPPSRCHTLGKWGCEHDRIPEKPPGKVAQDAPPVLDQSSSSSLMLLLPRCGFYMLPALKRRLSLQRANPGVTGVGGGGGGGMAAHVPIFQLWSAMFSLACSALLERGPEKLSVSRNPSLYPDLQRHGRGGGSLK